PEILEIIERIASVRALIHITGDGLLNLPRVAAEVGFVIDNLPRPPPIFGLIEEYAAVERAEMFEVCNMGIGFCVVVAGGDVESASARRLTELPGVLTGGRISTWLPSTTGMFMKRLSGDGVSDGTRPSLANAAARLSVQLSWYPAQPSSS